MMKRLLWTSLSVFLLGALAAAQTAIPFVLQPLRPVSATPGISGLTLTVTGVGFVSGGTVNWNGSPRATTVVSSTKLTASITAVDLAHIGIAQITVSNPGSVTSNVVYFPVHQKSSPGGFARADMSLANSVSGEMYVADFNNDGKLDVIVGSSASGTKSLEVFLGNGDGTFQSPLFSPEQYGVGPVAIGDFNGDGKLDVIAEGAFGIIGVNLGNGDGTFTEQPTYYTPSYAGYETGDVNGDGKLDLIVNWGEEGAYGTDVWLGNGDGTFTDVQSLTNIGGGGSALSDFNRDGKLDLAISAFSDLEVANGLSSGTFNSPVAYNLGNYEIFGIWAGDLNNDGKPDLVTDAGLVFMNKGNGTFNVPTTQSFPGIGSVQLLDSNGDGKVDILGIAPSTGGVDAVGIYAGNGDGTFQSPVVTQTSWGYVSAIGYGDFNGDGRIDMVTTSQDLLTGLPVMSVFLQNNLRISQSIISFGVVKLGQSASQTSTLTNSGSTTLTLGTISLSGTSAGYSLSKTCGTSLTAGASCGITISFSPKVKSQLLPEKVKINFSGTIGSPQYIEMNGQGG